MDIQIQDALYNILLTIVTTGTPIVLGYIVMFIKNHASAKQLQTAKDIALNSITYAEQVSKTLGFDNQAKLNSALASAKMLASKYGVKLSDDQWKNLLEPALKEAKIAWNELGNVTLPIENSEAIQVDLNEVSDVAKTSESIDTQGVEGNLVETQKNTLIVPDDMIQETVNQIKAKATNDAEVAVKSVLENVSKSISVE